MPNLTTTDVSQALSIQSPPVLIPRLRPGPIDRLDGLTDPEGQPVRSGFRAHLYVGLPLGMVLLAFVWMVTYGTWQLTVPESFGQFFDVQAESLLAGRWDVPPQGIGFEAFIHNGKFYGYFGFIPALARIGLNSIAPSMWGCWSRLSLTLGCCVALVYAYQLLLETRQAAGLGPRLTAGTKWVYAGYLIAAGLGSTLIFLASRAYIYHEAIIWGSALALGCYCHLMRYLRKPTATGLAIACALCFGSFFSRVSVGSGAVAAIFLLAVCLAAARALEVGTAKRRWRDVPLRWLNRLGRAPVAPRGHALAAGATVLAVIVVYVAVNQAKFGTWFDGMPFKLYNQVLFERSRERMQRTRGSAVSWANFRTDANAYFSFRNIRFARCFPFVTSKLTAYFYPESRYDIVERYASLTASTPALSLLAVGGLCCAFVRPKRRLIAGRNELSDEPGAYPAIVMIGAILGAVPVLFSAGISERYLHDFYPLLILGGALGVNRILALRWRLLRWGLLSVLAGLVFFSIWANVSFALIYQRTVVWGVPKEKQMEFLQWQDQVERWIDNSIPQPVASEGLG
jgi:hypothetical protein